MRGVPGAKVLRGEAPARVLGDVGVHLVGGDLGPVAPGAVGEEPLAAASPLEDLDDGQHIAVGDLLHPAPTRLGWEVEDSSSPESVTCSRSIVVSPYDELFSA